MSVTVVAAVVAAVALCGGAGAVDAGHDSDTGRSGRTPLSSTQDGTAGPVTTVWRPR